MRETMGMLGQFSGKTHDVMKPENANSATCMNDTAEQVVKSLITCHADLDGIEARLFRSEPCDRDDGKVPQANEPCLERALFDADHSVTLLHKRLARIAERL